MKRFVLLLSLAGLAVGAVPVHAGLPDSLAVLGRDLQAAVNAGSAARVLDVRARLQSLVALEPNSADLQCALALADWRAVPLLMRDAKDKAERRCAAGIAAADRALALDSKLAEALALKASLEGLSLSFRPADGRTLGPQIEQEIGRALDLDPNNPRILLFDGINTLHKPAFVGGGPEQALPKFQRAIARFEADPTITGWGRDDACLWAGRAAMQLQDYAAAREYFTKALAANPDNEWVKHSLLPEAEKSLAEKPVAKAKP